MLHDFLTENRVELLGRCKERVSKRYEQTPQVVDHGVPLFLQQLTDTLKAEQLTSARSEDGPGRSPVPTEIGRAATLHGIELLRLGYSLDQVVHQYGDVCQAVTEMAAQKKQDITADEFRTLNRCLDEAIADAVTAFADEHESELLHQATDLHQRLGALAEEQRRLVELAIQTFSAIQAGNLGSSGATGAALTKTLTELQELVDRVLPEIRLMTGITKTH